MLAKLQKLIIHIKRYGIGRTLRKIIVTLVARSGLVTDVETHRSDLSRRFDKHFNSTVAYGPLKGFRFCADSWWSRIDRSAMIFGLYEQEVLQAIAAQKGRSDLFIDIGAADGYYGVACVSQGIFKRSICFEISDIGQRVIAQTAQINHVADHVAIHGIADADVLSHIPETDRNSATVLLDIEGAEFDFLTDQVLALFKSSVIFIELHEWNMPDPKAALQGLEDRVRKYFDISVLTMGARDLSVFPELQNAPDLDRWVICMEGRATLQKWWKLTPLPGI